MQSARPRLLRTLGWILWALASLYGPALADDFRYFGVFFGPATQQFDSLQNDGTPIYLRNFLSWNRPLDTETRMGASLSWNWRPVQGQDWTLRDPFIKVSKPRAWQRGNWNWYTDVRLHLPVTQASHDRDLWAAIQSFNSLDWETPAGGGGLYASLRRNVLGTQGGGDEWEFYAAPHAEWQVFPKLSVGALLEWVGGTPFGEDARVIYSDGWSLQPGLSWDAASGLNLSPFLNLPLSTRSNGSLGLTLSWKIGG